MPKWRYGVNLKIVKFAILSDMEEQNSEALKLQEYWKQSLVEYSSDSSKLHEYLKKNLVDFPTGDKELKMFKFRYEMKWTSDRSGHLIWPIVRSDGYTAWSHSIAKFGNIWLVYVLGGWEEAKLAICHFLLLFWLLGSTSEAVYMGLHVKRLFRIGEATVNNHSDITSLWAN